MKMRTFFTSGSSQRSFEYISNYLNIRKCLENGDLFAGVYLDLNKAFYTVDHESLLYKLDYYGIRGHIYKWFRHYLK